MFALLLHLVSLMGTSTRSTAYLTLTPIVCGIRYFWLSNHRRHCGEHGAWSLGGQSQPRGAPHLQLPWILPAADRVGIEFPPIGQNAYDSIVPGAEGSCHLGMNCDTDRLCALRACAADVQ